MLIRKKPVVVECRFFTDEISSDIERTEELAEWCGGVVFLEDSRPKKIIIPTLEGDHDADIGDCIIKGVLGEFYPCKPDAFEITYDIIG